MAGSKYVWYDFMEEGEVDLDPGWDTAPLPPIDPSRDLERPVDLALSGVMGVPEFLRPGRAEKKSLPNKKKIVGKKYLQI